MSKVLVVLREDKTGAKDKIDLLYDEQSREFILRFWQWGSLREAVVLTAVEFIKLLQVGIEYYGIVRDDADILKSMTDMLQ